MNNVKWARLCALMIGCAVLGATNAQGQQMGVSAKVGSFFPGHSEGRDAGSQWVSFGLEYRVRTLSMSMTEPASSTGLTISADFFQAGDYRNIPVLLNFVSETGDVYWAFGAGVGFGKTQEVETSGSSTIFTTESRTNVAYAMRVGYNITRGASPMFVELGYQGSSEARLSGFSAMVGTRF